MGLDVWFREDVTNRLLALYQANERALTLARRYGMDAEAADLCWQVYIGCLLDVATSFGLALAIPKRKKVTYDREEIDRRAGHAGIPAATPGHRRGIESQDG